MDLACIINTLGGKKIIRATVRSRMDLIELTRVGLTKAALLHLAGKLSLSTGQMAALLPVTERTIQRYTLRQHFSRAVSEHILQIAEVAARGIEVFHERERFLAWLNHPGKALDNRTPVSLLNSRIGAEIVLDELGRIEYGIIS